MPICNLLANYLAGPSRHSVDLALFAEKESGKAAAPGKLESHGPFG